MLAAGIGGGAVAIWDSTGPWEARGIGWPGCGGYRERKSVRTVLLAAETALLGCGDGRVVVLGLDARGGTEDAIVPGSNSSSGVKLLAMDRSNCVLAVGHEDSLSVLDMTDEGTVVDWEMAARVGGLEPRPGLGSRSRFWCDS
jgi:hypothetical protein